LHPFETVQDDLKKLKVIDTIDLLSNKKLKLRAKINSNVQSKTEGADEFNDHYDLREFFSSVIESTMLSEDNGNYNSSLEDVNKNTDIDDLIFIKRRHVTEKDENSEEYLNNSLNEENKEEAEDENKIPERIISNPLICDDKLEKVDNINCHNNIEECNVN